MSRGGQNFIDMTGQVFPHFQVLRRANTNLNYRGKNKQAIWICKCECGCEFMAYGYTIRNGSIKSCGCYRQKWAKQKMDDLWAQYRKEHKGDGR